MKCFRHAYNDALSTCAHCGRGLCQSCMFQSRSGRIVCSSPCAEQLSATEDTLQLIREKMIASTRYGAYFLFAAGFLFGGFGLLDLRRGRWQIAAFVLALALIFMISAAALLWMLARKHEARPDSSTIPVADQYPHEQAMK